MQQRELRDSQLRIPAGMAVMAAELRVPAGAAALVVLAYAGSGLSIAQTELQQQLGDAGIASLAVNLMTPDEAAADRRTRHVRYDGSLLAARLVAAVDWLSREAATAPLVLGLQAEGTTAAAVLITAVRREDRVGAVACTDGLYDVVRPVLARVSAPVLLLARADEAPLRTGAEAAAVLLTASRSILLEEARTEFRNASSTAEWFLAWLSHPAPNLRPTPVAA
jgi:putative phosphoribosyl transferase